VRGRGTKARTRPATCWLPSRSRFRRPCPRMPRPL
jgi:hypothetical protein